MSSFQERIAEHDTETLLHMIAAGNLTHEEIRIAEEELDKRDDLHEAVRHDRRPLPMDGHVDNLNEIDRVGLELQKLRPALRNATISGVLGGLFTGVSIVLGFAVSLGAGGAQPASIAIGAALVIAHGIGIYGVLKKYPYGAMILLIAHAAFFSMALIGQDLPFGGISIFRVVLWAFILWVDLSAFMTFRKLDDLLRQQAIVRRADFPRD